MRVAITGGNGFVGAALAELLEAHGHEAVKLSRRNGGDVCDAAALRRKLRGCDAVVHAAGINREVGDQAYTRVHVQGARNVVEAARANGLKRVVLVSFLRARPDCGSGYHESKYEAEQIVRESGLPFVIFKPGVIYGRGDHMLDHLKRAFLTFPVFAFVGMRDQQVAPLHVSDMARLLFSALTDDRLLGRTFAALGPETLTLREAVLRVAKVVGRRPLAFRMPVWFHRLFAIFAEAAMRVPVVSRAQVRILSEGVVEPSGECDPLPADLLPTVSFDEDVIRHGLPDAGRYRLSDLRCCRLRGGFAGGFS
ncbi:MAG: NAD-dependent epimerase/dehydratase family protein [Planctomycetes bacterium]|nr:NAD-dependent epimerase/dehydratase family protein [Planctomycetota bacterium]